ncbi:hypothetical protein AURDEDRAFT_72243 [Auricularia subglabra TFB-10046 SS5]|nr:hypothetical protein AURDEDRAFT_72243 [Auricularia subglabra TFB-10046 SS5]
MARLRQSQDRTHRRHFRGWLSYAFASEVFAVVSLTLFLPIMLEQYARDNGFLTPEHTVPCMNNNATQPAVGEETRCAVRIGWAWIDTASFSLYTFSASVAIQALTVISVGAIADQRAQIPRKPLLLAFAAIGSISTTAFLLLSSSSRIWLACSLLAILANVSFGTSIVAMNAYLPDLAKGSPKVRAAWDEVQIANESNVAPQPVYEADLSTDDVTSPLIAEPSYSSIVDGSTFPAHRAALAHYNRLLSLTTSRISSQGIALGYSAGIVLLLLTLVPVTLMRGSTWSLRVAIGASGIWWALFTLPAAWWLPSSTPDPAKDGERMKLWTEVKGSWARLGQMLLPKEVRRLKNTFWYLAACDLIIVGVLTPTAGIGGAVLWPRIQHAASWSNIRVVLTLVVLASLIPVYGCLGFLSIFHGDGASGKYHFGGLTTKGEMFALAVYFGSVFGAFQSYARAVYAELIPRGEEARWFSLYSITDKSSSFLGPLCVGVIADATGNIRYAFFFLVFMMWASMPLLLTVNVDQGREDARRVSEEREHEARVLDL